MEPKYNMNMDFIQVPEAPTAPPPPPMYPVISNQQQNSVPPLVFYNGQVVEAQKPPNVAESRPASVFILNGPPPIGPQPLKITCSYCNTHQTTRIVPKVVLKTHFAALICCLLGLVCLVPLPYCMNSFKHLHHYCDNCGQYLGSYPQK